MTVGGQGQVGDPRQALTHQPRESASHERSDRRTRGLGQTQHVGQRHRLARFRQDLDQLLARKFRDLAANQYDLEAYDQAIDLYTQALTHVPGDPAALTGRADAYQAGGELKKAAADRDQAKQAGG